MIGALLQLDQYSETRDALGSYNDSHGVLFGPYASIRLAPDLVLDASAARGGALPHSALLPKDFPAFPVESVAMPRIA
jgi:hypothetical protein